MQNKYKSFLKNYRSWLIVSGTMVLTIAMYFVQNLGDYFEASILTQQIEETIHFDGTVYPIQEVPIWTKWTGDIHTDHYSSVSPSQVMSLPSYNLSLMKTDVASLGTNTELEDIVRNTQLTYSVLWTGGYEFDHQIGTGSHPAVDIRVPVGTPIYSIANGIVTKAVEQNSGFGYHIVVKHPNLPEAGILFSSYSHLSKVSVQEGDVVYKGQKIGESGETGTATTPHLHFQIDKETAPWYPYWPFSFSEINDANLSFFEAINIGFGIENVRQYTIDPLPWVEKHLHYSGTAASTPTTSDLDTDNLVSDSSSDASDTDEDTIDDVQPATFDSFSFELSKGSIYPDEESTLYIEARDTEGLLFSDYDSSHLEIDFSSNVDVEIVQDLQFDNGHGKVVFVAHDPGTCIVKAFDDNVTNSFTFEVLHKEVLAETLDYTLELHAQKKILPGTSINITVLVRSLDDGDIIQNFSPQGVIPIQFTGDGKVSKSSLSAVDFLNGKASLRYSNLFEGTSHITIGNSSIVIESAIQYAPVKKFKFVHSGKLQLNKPNTITLQAIDKNGAFATHFDFDGSVRLILREGKGDFNTSKLKLDDFVKGEAEFIFTPRAIGNIVLQAEFSSTYGDGEFAVRDIPDTPELSLFSDVNQTHPNFSAIMHLAQFRIIEGYGDGTFRPNDPVNRVEALKILLLSENVSLDSNFDVPFSDVNKSSWYMPYLATAYKNNIVSGYSDGTFRPGRTVNRAELLKIALEMHGVTPSKLASLSYSDVVLDDWYAPYAEVAKLKNLIDVHQNRFEASKPMTRAELAELIYRLTMLDLSRADSFSAELVI